MTNVRPKRTGHVRVDDYETPGEPPIDNRKGEPRGFFSNDYDNMFPGMSSPFTKGGGIQGPSGCTLETLVATLANLQFTTKGKVGEDGKFELIFCSPEPVVSEVKPQPTELPVKEVKYVEVPVQPEPPKRVQFIDNGSSSHRKRHRSGRRGWFDT